MPVALEFYNFLVPIYTIEKKYPGGWEQCLKDNESASAWYDGHLFRMGATNALDIESIVGRWKKMGFEMTEEKNGRRVWKDCYVTGGDEPCEWLELLPEKSCAYLKGTDPEGLVYGMMFPEDLRVIGAMVGNISGSGYVWHNVKYKPGRLIRRRGHFTGDSVLTYAAALGILEGMKKIDRAAWMNDAAMRGELEMEIALSLKRFARKYKNAGYGKSFRRWAEKDGMERDHSWGNGSAMRASFAGWYADSLEEAELLGKVSASFTHGHPEGIKGAVVVAGCIWLLRSGYSKDEVRGYAGKSYDLNFTLDGIRDTYEFDNSCAGSVPQSIAAFLENDSFPDVIRAAISIGGDSDTLAAIAGSIAEARYPIPEELMLWAWAKLDGGMKFAVRTVAEALRQLHPEEAWGQGEYAD